MSILHLHADLPTSKSRPPMQSMDRNGIPMATAMPDACASTNWLVCRSDPGSDSWSQFLQLASDLVLPSALSRTFHGIDWGRVIRSPEAA